MKKGCLFIFINIFFQNISSHKKGNLLLYFHKNVKNFKPIATQSCPYLENSKCTARDFRFAGCRIFFCKADSEQLNQLSEQAIKKFKTLCEKYDLPYRYADLATAMNSPELLDLIE